ncbi:transcriptional regulator [Mycolicibacterium murale]|uniref:Transcriptional regulator n=1 Tax=Mycolicibacterium murale TaxID=182220 RepID=A0A7I9WND0_9MYCO|nr:AraC family transcriptional regulator [Mycolicibacterium murale]MCV7184634.1 AraC family transcriptional regulator ligand-binding domain-containing protein [Mycolicibacterium murale]GFG59069.1 transcriptional regulator [Mycolicibacterium murale]
MGGRTISVQFVRVALAMAGAGGHDTVLPLALAGLPAELVDQDAARVTETQATRLVQALWDGTDDEVLGVGPKPVPRGTFAMMTLGVIHAPDLAEALRRLVEFARIGLGFDATLTVADGTVTLTLDSAEQHQAVAAVFLAVVHRFSGWLVGRHLELAAVQLPGPIPAGSAEYRDVYGVAPRFGCAAAALTFDARQLRARVIQNESTLGELIRDSPSALLFRQHYRPSAASQVRRILDHSAAPSLVSLEAAARLLNVSDQHLRRLLRDEGSSFRQIKEDVLRDDAVASLAGGIETVDALSERLGFSEPSAFRRAFRRWTGSPPSAYRPKT